MLFIQVFFLLYTIAATCWLTYKLAWAWKHQDDWPAHCAYVAAWKKYFNEEVAHGWTFYDGQGY